MEAIALPRVAVPLALFMVKVGNETPFKEFRDCAPVPLRVNVLPVSTKVPPENVAEDVKLPAMPNAPLMVMLLATLAPENPR